MATILIIDDEPSICWGLAELGKRRNHEVIVESSAEGGLAQASRRRPDLILLDVRLPGMDGLTALPQLQELAPAAAVVVMTAHGDLGTAVEAVGRGAFDYVAKPFDLAQIERVIDQCLASSSRLIAATASDGDPDGLVGKSPAMQEAFKRIALVAPTEACVLLAGESGTGKELAARAIHKYSRHKEGPFVAVNVAALSPTLAESELFGHVRGAFTGADAARPGLLVQAFGGTLFLDEIADMPLSVQVKLLRAIERREVMPVGSETTVPTRFRLICATHRDLTAAVRAGEFRHDLYYRLSAFQVDLLPLRQRRSDIPALVRHFWQQLAGDRSPRLSQDALTELQSREWYGNVRELRNAVEYALIVARDGIVMPEHLPPPLPSLVKEDAARVEEGDDNRSEASSCRIATMIQKWTQERLEANTNQETLYDDFLAAFEPPFLQTTMANHRGQCTAAARAMGIHRTTLKKKLDQYGIVGDD